MEKKSATVSIKEEEKGKDEEEEERKIVFSLHKVKALHRKSLAQSASLSSFQEATATHKAIIH